MQDTFFYRNQLINCRGRLLDLSRPVVMGILNITPDSFFDGGKFTEEESIVKQVRKMFDDGAAIIDIGASSSRPGAPEINEKDERARLIPVLNMLLKTFPEGIFSVDTTHSETAVMAIKSGAHIINDISGGSMDERMFEVVADLQVPYILMHIKGTPADMQFNPVYVDVVREVMAYFVRKMEILRQLKINDIIIDPGFGFGKTTDHNYELLNHLEDFRTFMVPVLVGVSRKSMINKVLGTMPAQALNGTTVLHTLALERGARILRVHDVKEAVEAIKLVEFSRHFKTENEQKDF